MALGATLFSMPAALLGSFVISVQNGFDAALALAAYAIFGSVFLLSITFVNGTARK